VRPLVRTLALAVALVGSFGASQGDVARADLEAILQARCAMCHGGATPSAGLRLDDLEGLLAGGTRGRMVEPGDPEGSELVRRLRGTSLPRMPLGPAPLSDDEIDLFARWIASGAETSPPAAGPVASAAAAPPAEPAAGPITYAQVEPILLQNCVRCHAASGVMGPPPEGYRLDAYAEALRSDDRARIVPFAPDASELVRRIRGHALPRMPLGGPPWLGDADLELIVAWVADGARDANGDPASVPMGAELRLHGIWRGDGTLDGLPLVLGDARIDDDARRDGYVQVRAVLAADGRIVVERIRGR
jgi:mono/diheme cytochrome c family protein